MTDTPPASLLGFEYQALIDDISKKSVGFQTTIGKDCTQEDLDSLLDKCRLAVTRQRLFAEIEARSTDLKNLEENIGRAQKELAVQDQQYSKRAENHEGRAERGLSASEQKDRQAKIAALANALEARSLMQDKLLGLNERVSPWPTIHPAASANGEQSRWSDNGGSGG